MAYSSSGYDPIRQAWKNMMDRCYNPKHRYFRDYGGRGIYVCEEWQSFENFKNDMAPRPEGLTLDRVNNDGPYSRDNCRWTDQRNQIRNRRNTLHLEYQGEIKTLVEWSEDERCSVSYNTLHHRIKLGWDIDEAITRPKRAYSTQT